MPQNDDTSSDLLFGENLISDCSQQRDIAGMVRKKVERPLRDIAAKIPVHTFKQRRKDLKQISEKVRRKRDVYDNLKARNVGIPSHLGLRENFNPCHVEDTWACRFVTLMQYEIIEAFEAVVDFSCSPISKLRDDIKLDRIVVYSNRPENDPNALHNLIKDSWESFRQNPPVDLDKHLVEPKSFKPVYLPNPENGYSSVHIILRVKVTHNYGSSSGTCWQPFEVQIRDIFEEGWSEISHRLSYKPSETFASESGDINGSQLLTTRQPSLVALKAAADAVSQHATIIERSFSHLLDTAGLTGGELSLSSLSEDMERILWLIQDDSSTAVLRQKIRTAYDMAETALKTSVTDSNNKAACEFSRRAVAAFDDVIQSIPQEILDRRVTDSAQGMPVRFYLFMERANARVKAHIPYQGNAEAAEDILLSIHEYEQLSTWKTHGDLFRVDATIQLRWGQALVSLSQTQSETAQQQKTFATAIEKLDEARKLAEADPKIGETTTYRWLPLQVKFEIGTAYGRLAQASKEQDNHGEFLAYAAQYSQGVVTVAEQHLARDSGFGYLAHQCLNTALFVTFLLEHHDKKVCEKNGQGYVLKEKTKRTMQHYIARLTERPLKKFTRAATETIDSIMMAASHLDQVELAKSMATQNLSKLEFIARSRAGEATEHVSKDVIVQYLDKKERVRYRWALRIAFPTLDSLKT